jgi:hypothetical protein
MLVGWKRACTLVYAIDLGYVESFYVWISSCEEFWANLDGSWHTQYKIILGDFPFFHVTCNM